MTNWKCEDCGTEFEQNTSKYIPMTQTFRCPTCFGAHTVEVDNTDAIRKDLKKYQTSGDTPT